MAIALLIGQTYFQQKSIINDNTDWQLIKPVVDTVQDLYLQKITGTNLYVALQNYVITYNNGIAPSVPIPTNYKLLIDSYIIPYLHWSVVAHSVFPLKYRYMNKGIVEKNSDNSVPSNVEDVKMIVQQYLNYAEQYGENLVKFLIANMQNYPEYTTNSTLDKNFPERTGFDSPFVFENEIVTPIGDKRSFLYRGNDLRQKSSWWS